MRTVNHISTTLFVVPVAIDVSTCSYKLEQFLDVHQTAFCLNVANKNKSFIKKEKKTV